MQDKVEADILFFKHVEGNEELPGCKMTGLAGFRALIDSHTREIATRFARRKEASFQPFADILQAVFWNYCGFSASRRGT